ncbi:Anoctamin-10 [Orchesella cincta]|uniref:Anoctamin n=1 Tax=Orchesella cincta TaxID=48709 RepID=A0A1D2MIS3_ORCCI|nr:Anoctamin-10 [Orchesella cincta]
MIYPKRKKRARRRNYELVEVELDDLFASLLGDDRDDGVVRQGGDNPLLNLLNNRELSSDHRLPDADLPDGAFEDPFAHTELVLKFHHAIHPSALKFFIERVTAKKSKGGAELLLRREPYMGHKKEGLTVHVTASDWRQLEVAEMMELKKMDYKRDDPAPREFTLKEVGNFLSEDMKHHEILTSAEKQMVVMHELRNLQSRPGERHVPGYDAIQLLPGDSLLHVYATSKLITSYFALHQADELNKLKGKWFWESFNKLPYEEIRSYYGDGVCLYFNFVAYYNAWLIVPAFFGLIMTLLPTQAFNSAVIYFCFLNMMFVILFLVNWQRKCSEISFLWGTLKMNRWEEQRADYDGVLAIDPVTGRFQRAYPTYKTSLKTCFGSVAVSVACIGLSMWMLHSFLDLDEWVKEIAAGRRVLAKNELAQIFWEYVMPALPGVGYAGCVFTANKLFRMVANALTEWENHRTQTQFSRHLISKMVVFEVFNSFASLFYTAFVIKKIDILKERVYTMLCVIQFLILLTSCVVPIIFRSGHAKMAEFLEKIRKSEEKDRLVKPGNPTGRKGRRSSVPYPVIENWLRAVNEMDSSDPRVQMSKVEANMDPYNYQADFEDYFLLLQQFGYVFLYSSVYPPAAAVAFGANMIILSASLYKLRQVYQRPFAKRVSNIGAWQQAFEAVGIIAVMTNCGLLCTNKTIQEYAAHLDLTDLQWMILFVTMEHVILGIHFFLGYVISTIPYNIKQTLAASEYRSWEAPKLHQAAKNRRRVTKLLATNSEQQLTRTKSDHSQGSSQKGKPSDVKNSNKNPQASSSSAPKRKPQSDAKSMLSKKKA